MDNKAAIQDYLELLKQGRKLLKSKTDCTFGLKKPLRIAVLGSCSLQQFVFVLRLLLYYEHIPAVLYEGEYDSILMDTLDRQSHLYVFSPDIVLLLPHYTDIKTYPPKFADKKTVEEQIDYYVSLYKKIWDNISHIEGCTILQANMVIPPLKELGNLEANYIFSAQNFIRALNLNLLYARPPQVLFVDLEGLASNVGKYNWFKFSTYFLSKSGFNAAYIGFVADLFVNQIKALIGKIKKCLVLDLDDTLWGGVVGDDGWRGIEIDPNNAAGEAYRFFQQYIKKLKMRGVILAVCSKNDEAAAKEPFLKNQNMVLHLEDIACFKANWDDKATNIKKIAEELNIGLDTLVFFDDNPAEREIVRTYLPQVLTLDVPEDPADYALCLDKAAPFDWAQLTQEDVNRSNSYSENTKREELSAAFVDYNQYLKALKMKGFVGTVTKAEVGRFAQLINKSNQFNLRTHRVTESAIETFSSDSSKKLLYVHLADKFSDYGIISCIILQKIDTLCFIDSYVMSCRVLKRGVEEFAFLSILDAARKWSCTEIIGEYIPTEKNNMVRTFYPSLGFKPVLPGDYPALAASLDKTGLLFKHNALDTITKPIYITQNHIGGVNI